VRLPSTDAKLIVCSRECVRRAVLVMRCQMSACDFNGSHGPSERGRRTCASRPRRGMGILSGAESAQDPDRYGDDSSAKTEGNFPLLQRQINPERPSGTFSYSFSSRTSPGSSLGAAISFVSSPSSSNLAVHPSGTQSNIRDAASSRDVAATQIWYSKSSVKTRANLTL
jgi:hypothetical protein